MSVDASAAPAPAPAPLVSDAPGAFASNDLPLVQSAEPAVTPNVTDIQQRRNLAAREMAAKLVVDGDGNPVAPAPATPAPVAAKPTTPTDDGKGKDGAKSDKDKSAEARTEPRANTVTERIGDLTRKNRELVTTRKALEAKLAEKDAAIATAVAEAKAAGAKEYKAQLRDKFKADAPGTIREELEEDWIAVIERVAAGGPGPTPAEIEAKKHADALKKVEEAAEAKAKEATDRIQKLEDERAAEKKKADEAKAREDAAKLKLENEQKFANSVKWVAEMIDPAKHPNLVNIRDDVAEEALSAVAEAMTEAQRSGKHPGKYTEAEANHFAMLALDGLQNYYADLVSKAGTASAAPGSGSSAPQTAKTATETAPAVSTAPVPQSRPPTTITSAVSGGETQRAANPVARSVLDAKEAAIAAARRLPPLSTE